MSEKQPPYGLEAEDWETIQDRFPGKTGDELLEVAMKELARRFYADEALEIAGTVEFHEPRHGSPTTTTQIGDGP